MQPCLLDNKKKKEENKQAHSNDHPSSTAPSSLLLFFLTRVACRGEEGGKQSRLFASIELLLCYMDIPPQPLMLLSYQTTLQHDTFVWERLV
jgi:hypothetical protein